jgi:hypothetical protein
MRTLQAESTALSARLGHLAEQLSDIMDRLTGGAADARDRLSSARESAGEAIAERPLRWTLLAFAAGVVVGAIVGYRGDGN